MRIPQLSDIYSLIKKTGYAEPMGAGGEVTFLALSNKLLGETKRGERFSNLEMLRDKAPPAAQLWILQALTLDGQYTQKEFDELITQQGSGKESGTLVLEYAFHNGTLIKASNGIVTPNGIVIIIDANAAIPK